MTDQPKQISCPRCRKLVAYSSENPYRPFCSERCKILDLGAWADEKYRVPTEETDLSASLEDLENQDQRPPNHRLQ